LIVVAREVEEEITGLEKKEQASVAIQTALVSSTGKSAYPSPTMQVRLPPSSGG